MNIGTTLPNGLLDQISMFLKSIPPDGYFVYIIILLVAVCIIRLARMMMKMFSPKWYSEDKDKAIERIADIAGWFVVLFSVPILYSECTKNSTIQYEECYTVLCIFPLLVVDCSIRLLRMIMITLSPDWYNKDKDKSIKRVADISFCFALFFTALVWIMSRIENFTALENAIRINLLAAGILIGLMVLTLLIAGMNMLVGRKGKRVFVAKALCRSSIVLAIEGSILLLLGYFLIP